MAEKVRDLRSALALLERMPDQLIETDVEVDPMAELAGVYRYVGAGGTVKRPTKEYLREGLFERTRLIDQNSVGIARAVGCLGRVGGFGIASVVELRSLEINAQACREAPSAGVVGGFVVEGRSVL